MIKKIIYLIFIILLCENNSFSQKKLKIEDAIAIGLKNNFDIQLGKLDYDISKANNTAGNSGMNPSLNLNANTTYSLYNTHLEYSNGNIADNNSNATFNFSTAIALSQTVFDGFKMFVTKDKLSEIEKLGEMNYQATIQSTIAKISTSYFDIIKQKQILKNIQEIKALSKERMIINETRFQSGLSAKTDLLQSQIDYNTHLQNEIIQIKAIDDSKRNLIQILNSPEFDFDVNDNFEISDIDTSIENLENNYQLTMLKKQMDISKLSIREIDALNLPTVSVSAGYNFNVSQTSTGLVNYNRGTGPIFGASLTYPIYLGGNINRQSEIANLNYFSSKLEFESLKSQLTKEIKSLFKSYIIQKDLLTIEDETSTFTKENLFLSIERLKLQQTTSLEVRDAQLMYENSLTRIANYSYNLKSIETQIRLLTGKLK